jgi:3D (Asp-Asp-Asp) domain-containing protein
LEGPDFPHAEFTKEAMKAWIAIFTFALLLAAPALAREQSFLARVTVYWRDGSSGQRASSNGARLHVGHCAVDPNKIPFGSNVVFDDATCVAVDSGPAVVKRRAARLCGRTTGERNALVVDRFFETQEQALAWARTHPHFMTLRLVTREPEAPRRLAPANPKVPDERPIPHKSEASPGLTKIPPDSQQHPDTELTVSADLSLRCARRRT